MNANRPRSILAALTVSLLTAAAPAGPTKLRALLLSGANNHNWQATTPALVKILEDSGRFAVTVENDPSQCTAATFGRYDVVVSNWTPWPNVKKRVWDEATEKAFLDFIRGGGGLAVFHAASTAMQTWPEFQQLVCATWGKGTGHGRQHKFKVVIADKAHPITAGLADFTIFDELWHGMPKQEGAKALCTAFSSKDNRGTGRDEPVAFYTRLGKGRGYNLVLGHGTEAMSYPGWQALMLRGTEWAATGKVTIAATTDGAPTDAEVDAALKALTGYRLDRSRAPLVAVEKLVNAAGASGRDRRKKLAARLAALLGSDATPEAKKFACGQLSLIGGDAEVPVLARLLGDKDESLCLAARSALERIPGEAPLAAMRAALSKASGTLRVGLIDSLGERRDPKAVELIAAALLGKDAVAAGAAADALGKIGGPEAAAALMNARPKLPPAARAAAADALLQCAAGLRKTGQTPTAAAIYERLSAPDEPRHVRIAAFPGLVACRKDKGAELLLSALSGTDAAMQLAAVRAARLIGDASLLRPLIDRLPTVGANVRAMIIEMLAERRLAAALPAVAAAAGADDALVRRAAIAALGRLGDASTVDLLAKLAAERADAEGRLARTALVRLRGKDVDAAMIGKLGSSAGPIRRELIVALTERRASSAVDALLKAAADEDRAVRTEAVKGLAVLAGAEQCPALIALLDKASADADRWAVESALVAVCRRAGKRAKASAPILAALRGADAKRTASLLRVLGQLGGPKALAAVRRAAKSDDADTQTAAIRALGDWADATPLEDLLALATSARQPVAKVLALRGFAKLSAKATNRDPEQLAGLYKQALAVAERAEDRKVLLGGLAGVQSVGAMQLACGCLAEASLADEAGLAATKIAEALWKSKPAPTRAAMKQVLGAKVSKRVAGEAMKVLVELSKPRNIALDAKATSPDGLESDGQASGDQAAIDGNPGTYWDEANGAKLYRLVVTFPEPRKVAVLRITGFNHHAYAPKDFDVLCDGKVVKAVRNAQYSDNRLTLAVPQTACKTVELKITGYYGASPAVRELEIFAIDPLKSIERN